MYLRNSGYSILKEVQDPTSGEWRDADTDAGSPGSNNPQPAGAQVLRALASTLPLDCLQEVLALLGSLATEPDRGSVPSAVLSRLPVDQRVQFQLCEAELEAAAGHKYPYSTALATVSWSRLNTP